MPTISERDLNRLNMELSLITTQWNHIKKFLTDEDEVLAPIYRRWLDEQDD
jgi:hypothetical protein